MVVPGGRRATAGRAARFRLRPLHQGCWQVGRYSWNCDNTGFPKKDARFLKIKNIPDLLSDDKEGELMGNFDF